jgi:hypothetical protein
MYNRHDFDVSDSHRYKQFTNIWQVKSTPNLYRCQKITTSINFFMVRLIFKKKNERKENCEN